MNTYPSKLLLLGEYTVLKGSSALAKPMALFHGKWVISEGGKERQQNLSEWLVYLRHLEEEKQLLAALELDQFAKDLSNGLYFESNIPTGYGAGSSGALCAGLYATYGVASKLQRPDELKPFFAQLESFFHGSSSGFDPLVSYLDQPVLIAPGGQIDTVDLPSLPRDSNKSFFLIDTHKARKTGPLVQQFMKACEDRAFEEAMQKELTPLIDKAIQTFVEGKWDDLWIHWSSISQLQFEYFSSMIPEAFRPSWKLGLERDSFKLKLCGAGGGGFILGYAWDKNQAVMELEGLDLLWGE